MIHLFQNAAIMARMRARYVVLMAAIVKRPLSGMWRRVAWQKFADAPEERTASSFMVNSASSTPNMNVARSSEKSATYTDYRVLQQKKDNLRVICNVAILPQQCPMITVVPKSMARRQQASS
jgi:hypothetical protein